MVCFGLLMTCSAKAMFSLTVLFFQQPEVLEDAAHRAAQLGHLPLAHLVEVLVGHPELALGGGLLTQQQTQERRFPGPGRADEEDELSLVDVDGDVLERSARTRGVELADMVEANHNAAVYRLRL